MGCAILPTLTFYFAYKNCGLLSHFRSLLFYCEIQIHPANDCIRYFPREDAKTRKKRRLRTEVASSRETAFFELRLPGSRYCLRNLSVSHLNFFLFFAFFDVKKRGFACELSKYAKEARRILNATWS